MEKLARGILALSILACALLLFWAFFQEKEMPLGEPSSNKQKNKTLAIKIMKSRGVEAAMAKNYYQAGQRHGIDWRLLASIGFAESDHGRSPLPGIRSGVNLAGCCSGMMQICTVSACGDVWSDYALDGNRNGQKSPYEKADSVFTAANYLSWMKDVVGSDKERLAAAYNAGPTLVANEGIPAYPETKSYIKKVQKFYRALQK